MAVMQSAAHVSDAKIVEQTDEPIRLSIIIGIQDAERNLPEIARVLGNHPAVEVLFCHASDHHDLVTRAAQEVGGRVIIGRRSSAIPHLWRDGLREARGDHVVTTTAHCVPRQDWVRVALNADLDHMGGIGGTIENDPRSDGTGCAIFLLRYAAFAPPQESRGVDEIAADNAVYRRSDLLSESDLLDRGFWEPSFHNRLRLANRELRIDSDLRVIHRNRYSARAFMRQRFLHGQEFGSTRAHGWSIGRRLAMASLAPVLFLAFFGKVVRRGLRNQTLKIVLIKSWFWLPVFTAVWIAGEVRGYLICRTSRHD